jgi:hypothetical protein
MEARWLKIFHQRFIKKSPLGKRKENLALKDR